jgi:putative mRNA 3-end processing factor
MKLLEFTDCGIFCKQANVYIDPWKPVDKAIITHGHSDHARWGNKSYLCHHLTKPILQWRLGVDNKIESVEYNEKININGVEFSLHPAGHIVGSAQIKVEYKGEVWVASGDYKLENDLLTEPFQPLKCHFFITESTFGLPIFKWKPQQIVYREIEQWWQQNQQNGLVSVLTGYTLGKAQRILAGIDRGIGPVFVHGAIHNMNEVLISAGIPLPKTPRVTIDGNKADFSNALIIAPPSALSSPWMRRFYPYSTGVASGWMSLRGTRRRRAVDRGFVISDHADWNDLNKAVKETGAEKVIITHGYRNTFAKWLIENNIDARVEDTLFEGELSEIGESVLVEEKE